MKYILIFCAIAFIVWSYTGFWGIFKGIYRKMFKSKLIYKQTLGQTSATAQALSSAIKDNDTHSFEQLANQASMDDFRDLSYFEHKDGHVQNSSIFSNYADSRPRDAVAQLLYGQHLIEKAWAERGTGTADTVTRSGFQGFARYLQHAEDTLQKSIELDPGIPDTHANMLIVKRGKDDLRDAQLFFENSKKRFPVHFGIHHQMSIFLAERWSGIEGEVLKFARLHSASDNTNKLQWLIPAAHLNVGMFETDLSVTKYFKQKEVREEIKTALKLYESIPNIDANDRDYLNGLQFFASTSFAALNAKQAKRAFKKMQGKYSPVSWMHWGDGDPAEPFIRAKWWAT